jgi:hypothetical protein
MEGLLNTPPLQADKGWTGAVGDKGKKKSQ